MDYAAKAREIHKTAILFDGHNDLPWQLREQGQIDFQKVDLATKQSLPYQTDIPRMRQGGLNAQFWSVYIPGKHPNPLRTVLEQIDIVHRMIQRYPNDFEQAFTAADVRRIAKSGKCASMIGVEGGVAIENDLSMLRILYSLGTRYMTLTHNQTLDWADAATDKPKNEGLSPFGVRGQRDEPAWHARGHFSRQRINHVRCPGFKQGSGHRQPLQAHLPSAHIHAISTTTSSAVFAPMEAWS